jgi:hypothetical protein
MDSSCLAYAKQVESGKWQVANGKWQVASLGEASLPNIILFIQTTTFSLLN